MHSCTNPNLRTKKNHLAVVFFVQAKITWRLPKRVQRVQQRMHQQQARQLREQQQEQLLLFYRKRPKQQQR